MLNAMALLPIFRGYLNALMRRLHHVARPCLPGRFTRAWLASLGQDWTYVSAEGVLHDIAAAVPRYAGLSYAKIGDLGYSVTHES